MNRPSIKNNRIFCIITALLITALTGCAGKTDKVKVAASPISHKTGNPAGYYFQYRGNLQRTGVFNVAGPSSPRLLWRYKAGASIRGSAALIPDGAIVFGTKGDLLIILEPDGRERKRIKLDSWVFSSPAVGPGALTYIGCDSGKLLCIEPSGKIKWEVTLNAETSSSPAITPDAIYIGAEDNALHCISLDGKPLWKFPVKKRILFSSPAVDSEGNIYIGAEDGFLYQVKPDGTKGWHFDCKGEISTTSPVIQKDGSIIIAAAENLFCVSNKGKLIWDLQMNEEMAGTPAVLPDDSAVVAGTFDGIAHIISPEGRIVKKIKLSKNIFSGPVADKSGIIFITTDKGLITLNPNGELLKKTEDPCWGPFEADPSIGADGRIYIGGKDGYMYCFGD